MAFIYLFSNYFVVRFVMFIKMNFSSEGLQDMSFTIAKSDGNCLLVITNLQVTLLIEDHKR